MDRDWKNTNWVTSKTSRRAGPFILTVESSTEYAHYWEISYEREREEPEPLVSGEARTLEGAKSEAESWIRDAAQAMWKPRAT